MDPTNDLEISLKEQEIGAEEKTQDEQGSKDKKKSGKVEKVSTAVPSLNELIESNQKYTQRLNRAAGLIRGFPRKLKRDFLICMKWEEENGV